MKNLKIHGFTLILVSLIITNLQAQQFKEVSREIGLEHLFDMGDLIFGGGVAVLDYDNDGWEDLYVTGGMNPDALFRNNGNKTFTNIFSNTGLQATGDYLTQGVVAGDINNDGFSDIFITVRSPVNDLRSYTHDLLFLNNGDGTFVNVTEAWNLHIIKRFSSAAAFGDVNLDGLLDLYVGTYLVEPVEDTFDEFGNASAQITGEKDIFYMNSGSSYLNHTPYSGIEYPGMVLGAVFSDYDNDHDVDLYVANDFGFLNLPPNLLYENVRKEKTFINVAPEASADIGMHAMGVAHGDYNNDGFIDYFITNMGQDFLLKNNGDGTFADSTLNANLVSISLPYKERSYLAVSWGTVFFDYDNDGWLDLFWANGDLSPPANPNPNKLYHNNGDGTFTDVTHQQGMGNHHLGRGAAVLDYDRDGDLDLVVVNQQYPEGYFEDEDPNILFYENINYNNNNYLQVKLKGVDSNSQGFGAHIIAHCGEQKYLREIEGGSSHLSQNSPIAHFGLGKHKNVDQLEIIWPGGKRQVLNNVEVNQIITVVEGKNSDVVTDIFEGDASINARVFPNPCQGIFSITRQFINLNSRITLTDLSGRLVHQFDLSLQDKSSYSMEFKIPATIPDGAYLLNIDSNASELLLIERE